MADEEPTTIIELRHPTQCVLWETPSRARAKFSDVFDEIESYEDDSHLARSLYKCKECGHLYFFEWMEWVDWEDGDDRQYSTLFPVETRAQVEAMKQAVFRPHAVLSASSPRRRTALERQGLECSRRDLTRGRSRRVASPAARARLSKGGRRPSRAPRGTSLGRHGWQGNPSGFSCQ